jgi:hypothetical protein
LRSTTGTIYLQSAAVEGVAVVTPHQAASWLKLLSEDHSVNLTITQGEMYVEQTANDVSAGLVSTFSSWGPSWELTSKPQFTAPGGYILSTYPIDLGGYAVLSGTSMAAPLVAGAYALLAQARNTTNPVELLSILASTAKPTKWFDGTTTHETWAPIPQQGSGQIQVYEAAQATSKLSVSSLELKDSDQFKASQTFTIENQGEEEVTYSIEELKAPTVYYFTPGTSDPALFPNPNVDDGATLTFGSDEVVVPAGGSADVNVQIVPPSLNETLLPSFSGYIKLSGSNNDTLLLPYVGVLGSLYQTPTMFPGDTYLASTANIEAPLDANTTFEMPHPSLNETGFHGPTPAIRLKTGTPQLRADVVAVSAVELPTTDFFGYPSLGSVPTYPRLWASKGGYMGALLGTLADGTILPEGAYKIVVSALRVSGDEEKESDWDIVELVPFELKYTQA